MDFHSYSSKCAFSSLSDIKNKHITIMGLGLNGGGEAAVRFFLKHGAYVLVTDMKSESELKPTLEKLNNDATLDTTRLTYCLGKHEIKDFENADCVIKNPGVKYEGNKFLQAAKVIETDLSIFLRFTNCPLIAVTGSKGKSSTVSAIYYGLKEAGYKTFLGGNITVSPLTFIDQVNQDTPVIIEFSSWQLADLRGRGILKPYISLITKIVPDHQNWYGNMEDYVKDKRLIYQDQDEGCYSIFDFDDDEKGTGPSASLYPDTSTWGQLFSNESKATVLRYSKSPFSKKAYGVYQEQKDGAWEGRVILPNMEKAETILKDICVPGEHMKTNVLNAALVMYLMNIPSKKIIDILATFPGVDHRLQYFHTWTNSKGTKYKFYNDTCATVPEAASAATQAFEKPVILLTGGTDKGLELDKFTSTVINKDKKNISVKDLYFLEGSATDKILPELDKSSIKYNGPFANLNSLLQMLKTNLEKEENCGEQIVVFSPGATSFGMFTNEFDRGNKFMTCVKQIF